MPRISFPYNYMFHHCVLHPESWSVSHALDPIRIAYLYLVGNFSCCIILSTSSYWTFKPIFVSHLISKFQGTCFVSFALEHQICLHLLYPSVGLQVHHPATVIHVKVRDYILFLLSQGHISHTKLYHGGAARRLLGCIHIIFHNNRTRLEYGPAQETQ